MTLVLASASPRRAELLSQFGLLFEVKPVDIDETPREKETPTEYVRRLSAEKAQAAPRSLPLNSTAVLGSDTAVIIEDKIFGKPKDYQDFCETMMKLSGSEHQVMSAVTLLDSQQQETKISITQVSFRELTRSEIEHYWQTGEPQGKAGGYAIQGMAAGFIREIHGSYSGVMGLPLYETGELLRKFNLWPLDRL